MKRLLLLILISLASVGYSFGQGNTSWVPNGPPSPQANALVYVDALGHMFSMQTSGAGTNCAVSINGAAPVWASCPTGSASTAISSLSAGAANNSVNLGNFTNTWTASTGTTNPLVINDTTGNTGTNPLFQVNTVGTSTAKPVCFFAQGTANGVCVTSAGVMTAQGIGAVNANQVNGSAVAGVNGDVTCFGSSNILCDSGFLAANVTRLDHSNTGLAAMTLNMSASTGSNSFVLPNISSCATSVTGALCYDTALGNVRANARNGNDSAVAVWNTNNPTNGDCASISNVSGALGLGDAGNCGQPGISGSGAILVTADSPGKAATPGGTITFTLGSATVTTQAGHNWPASAVGSIVQYNSGTNPVFRTVVLSVAAGSIVVSSPAPFTATANADGTTSGTPASTNWNSIADACAQMNASILNHPGQLIDALGITGNAVTCTINPFSGATIQGGELWIGRVKFVTQRTWAIPTRWHMRGLGRGDSTSVNSNTTIQADSTNFPASNYSAVNVTSSGVSTATNSATFTDTNGTFQTAVTGAVCDTGAYGHLTVGTVIPGWVEGQMITFQSFANWTGTVTTSGTAVTLSTGSNFQTNGTWNGVTITINSVNYTISSVASTTSLTLTSSAGTQGTPVNYTVVGTGWNGNWTVAGISGTSVEVFFGNEQNSNLTCPLVGIGSPVADPFTLGLVQAQQAVTVTGTLNSAAVVNISGVAAQKFIQITDNTAEFVSGMVGNCTINTTTPTKSYTITDFISTTVVNIFTGSDGDPGWSGKAFTMTCWEQGYITATGSTTTLTLNSKAAYALVNGTNVTYNASAPVVALPGYGYSEYATSVENLLVDCGGIAACVGIFDTNGQENSRLQWITVARDTGVGFLFTNSAGNSGPHTGLEVFGGGPAASYQIPPVTGIQMWFNGAVQNAGIDRCTIIGDIRWWGAITLDGAGYAKGCHTESAVNGVEISKYADTTNGATARGVLLYEYYGGVNQYNDVRIENSGNADIDIRGLTVSNAAAHDTIEDLSIGQACTAGGISDVHTTQAKPSLSYYTLGHDAYGYRTRVTSESGPAVGGTNIGGQVMNCMAPANFGGTYGLIQSPNNAPKLTANTANITATTLATATPFLTFTAPAGTDAGNVAGKAFINSTATGAFNWTFDCKGVYSQATASATNLWGLSVTGGSLTRVDAEFEVGITTINPQVYISGAVYNNTTLTTPVQAVSAAPTLFGAVGTLADMLPWHIWGVLQQAGGSTPPTLNLLVASGSSLDAITVYAGSMCTVW